MEKPDPKKFSADFDQAVGAALGEKNRTIKPFAARKPDGAGAIETSPSSETARDFTPDDVFWHKGRKAMLEDLKAEIHRISWLDENKIENPEIVKAIPKIGVDLRAAKINKMLKEEYKGVEPGSAEAHKIMTELREMWANQWLNYLEKNRYGGQGEKTERPITPEPTPKPKAGERVADSSDEKKPLEKPENEKEVIELDQKQQKTFEGLIQKSGIREITKGLKETCGRMDPEERKIKEDKDNNAVQHMEDIFKRMIAGSKKEFSEDDLAHFTDNFFNPDFLKRYKEVREAKKIKTWEEVIAHRNEFVEFMGKLAQKNEYSGQGSELIKSYFRTLLLLEARLHWRSK